MTGEDVSQDRGQRQQQGKDREERVVSDQRGQVAGLVITELAKYRKRQCQPRMALLIVIEPCHKTARLGRIRSTRRDIPVTTGQAVSRRTLAHTIRIPGIAAGNR